MPSRCLPTLLALLCFAPATASAGWGEDTGEEGGDGTHTHDGLFLRFTIGPAYSDLRASDSAFKSSGQGLSFGFAIGGALNEDVILFGEIVQEMRLGSDIELGDSDVAASSRTMAGTIGMGAGVAHYVVPLNLFVSATAGVAEVMIDDDGVLLGESEFGPFGRLGVGKEWWVSENWGLGVALVGTAAWMPNGRVAVDRIGYSGRDDIVLGKSVDSWTLFSLGVAFSATYN